MKALLLVALVVVIHGTYGKYVHMFQYFTIVVKERGVFFFTQDFEFITQKLILYSLFSFLKISICCCLSNYFS